MKKRISKICGVTGTDYSYLTHKLRVKYEGDRVRLQEIESQIEKVLQSKQRSGL